MSADSLVAAFASESGTGAFPNIVRATVATQIRERLADPTRQDQAAASLCGPASLLFCLLQDDPEAYVRYVTSLYNTGSARIGTLSVRPGADCRNYSPPPARIAAVDWIALASLRDSENSVLDYQSVDNKTAGITRPSALADWFQAAGYQQIQNVTNLFFTKGRSEIDSMHALRLQGRRVCMLINAGMLDSAENTSRSTIPNHWVPLASAAGVRNDQISLRCYSWGQTHSVPPSGTLAVGDFSRNFYGYVAASYPRRGP